MSSAAFADRFADSAEGKVDCHARYRDDKSDHGKDHGETYRCFHLLILHQESSLWVMCSR